MQGKKSGWSNAMRYMASQLGQNLEVADISLLHVRGGAKLSATRCTQWATKLLAQTAHELLKAAGLAKADVSEPDALCEQRV